MESGKIIAINLNELRTEWNLMLGQLSKISEISKAVLSNIGRDSNNPTINILQKIANGSNVSYTRLMERVGEEATVIRKSEPAVQTGETDHYRIYCCSIGTPVRDFKLLYVELGAYSSSATIGHSGKA